MDYLFSFHPCMCDVCATVMQVRDIGTNPEWQAKFDMEVPVLAVLDRHGAEVGQGFPAYLRWMEPDGATSHTQIFQAVMTSYW